MRLKKWSIVGVGVAALVFAGFAIADETLLSQTTSSASASATTVSDLKSSTCTNTNGTFESTRGQYTGNSTGLSLLSGPLKINAHSLVNTSNGVGTLSGHFSVNGSGKGETKGKLDAVLSNGTLAGWITGHGPSGKFEGTFTGTWDKKTGFGSLSIGTSSTSNVLVVTIGHCQGAKTGAAPKGATGPTGASGPHGPKPHGSPHGASGPTGPSGATGPTGPSGPHGPKKPKH